MDYFAYILKNLRTQRNMSQADLARLLGISRSAVSSYENGSRSPDKDILLKIAVIFQVSIDYLLGYDKPVINNSSEYGQILSKYMKCLCHHR
jgi:transcriptional regulator with XRE-family HTH domain